jgi:surface antigen
MSLIKSCVSGAVVLGLVGCANVSQQDVGTISGGVIGALVGSQFGGGVGQVAATGVGMLVGAKIGGLIGKNMDDVDRLKVNQALESAQTNETIRWVNPDNGNHYAVTPKRTYRRHGQPCREYTTTAIIGGKKQEIYGTACRTSDGSWRVVN